MYMYIHIYIYILCSNYIKHYKATSNFAIVSSVSWYERCLQEFEDVAGPGKKNTGGHRQDEMGKDRGKSTVHQKYL